jgi:hypothetical protein
MFDLPPLALLRSYRLIPGPGRKGHTVPYGTEPFSQAFQAVPAWLRSISRYATGSKGWKIPHRVWKSPDCSLLTADCLLITDPLITDYFVEALPVSSTKAE